MVIRKYMQFSTSVKQNILLFKSSVNVFPQIAVYSSKVTKSILS